MALGITQTLERIFVMILMKNVTVPTLIGLMNGIENSEYFRMEVWTLNDR